MITDDRLNDAVRRILGLKAKIHLPQRQAQGTLQRNEEELSVIGCDEHLTMQQEAADLGITLVKNTLDRLPIRPETHKTYVYISLKARKMAFINQMIVSKRT